MRRKLSLCLALILSLSTLGWPARAQYGYGWIEYLYDYEGDGTGTAMVHHTDSGSVDWIYFEIYSGDLDVQSFWSATGGMQLMYAWLMMDGTFVYPDYPEPVPDLYSIGLAPLPGVPPCNGDDCASCIQQQLSICRQNAKASYTTATAGYVVDLTFCIASASLSPWLALACATAAGIRYASQCNEIIRTRKQCEHDRPRQCRHAENGDPCLP